MATYNVESVMCGSEYRSYLVFHQSIEYFHRLPALIPIVVLNRIPQYCMPESPR